MKFLKIEDRQLPLFYEYVIVQLNGRPVYALLWFVWLWWSAAIMIKIYSLVGYFRSNFTNVIFYLAITSGGMYFLDLIIALARHSSRQWLFQIYHERHPTIKNSSSRLAVRVVPILSFVGVVLFLLFEL